MKSKLNLLKGLCISLCILVFGVFGVYKGCVLLNKHLNDKFLSVYDGIICGQHFEDTFIHLGTKPIYDLELTSDNIEYIKNCGLKSLPPMKDNYGLRVAIFSWGGIPHRFMFVFYEQKGSNVVAKAHCKI